MHPLEILKDFYSSQHPYVRERLAMESLWRLEEIPLDNPKDEAVILHLTPSSSGLKDLGTVLTFRAMFDWSFRTLGDDDHWQKTIDWQLDLVDSGGISSGMRNGLHSQLPALPERRQASLEASKEWNALRRAGLSDNALAEWEYQQFLKLGRGRQ